MFMSLGAVLILEPSGKVIVHPGRKYASPIPVIDTSSCVYAAASLASFRHFTPNFVVCGTENQVMFPCEIISGVGVIGVSTSVQLICLEMYVDTTQLLFDMTGLTSDEILQLYALAMQVWNSSAVILAYSDPDFDIAM